MERLNSEEKAVRRKVFIRKQAITVDELMKGFLPEQRDNFSNELKTIEELTGYIMELTVDVEGLYVIG